MRGHNRSPLRDTNVGARDRDGDRKVFFGYLHVHGYDKQRVQQEFLLRRSLSITIYNEATHALYHWRAIGYTD